MTAEVALRATAFVAECVWLTFLVTSVALSWLRERLSEQSRAVLVRLRMETKPFALWCGLAGGVPNLINDPDMWDYLSPLCVLFGWWVFRNLPDDDDRWKRRKEKLAERIAEVGGRLQVVPQVTS